MIKKVLLCLATLSFVTASGAALTGCNTVQGAGKDIERGGEKVQDAAEGAKKKM